jgi:hypothetical protein
MLSGYVVNDIKMMEMGVVKAIKISLSRLLPQQQVRL